MAPLVTLKDLFRWSAQQRPLPVRLAPTWYSRSRILIHSVVRPSTSVPSSSPHQLLYQTSFFKYTSRFPIAVEPIGISVSTHSPLSRVDRDERISTKSANQLDISSFNASDCSSHGSGSTNLPHPHSQRTRKPSALNTWTRWTRFAKRKLLRAVWLAQWLRSAERMERLRCETCGLSASARRRMVGVGMSRALRLVRVRMKGRVGRPDLLCTLEEKWVIFGLKLPLIILAG